MTTTAIGIGIFAGLVAAVLIIRYVEKQRADTTVTRAGFDVPKTAVRA